MRRRHRAWPVRALLAAVLAAGLVGVQAPPPSQAEDSCPSAFPINQLTPGRSATGLTVVRGTTPESFSATVIDVLDDALAPGIPLVVAEVDSAAIRRVGGAWSGMSGSPVYLDGQLLGAVAYGFAGASPIVGLTPAAAMLAVPDRPSAPPPLGLSAEVTTSPRVRARAIERGIPALDSAVMQPLRVPVQVTGVPANRLAEFTARFEQRYPGTMVVSGPRAAAPGTPVPRTSAAAIVPGGNLGVSLSYGDITAAGVGTVTAVCNGTVIGFGHPLLYAGATRLGLHGASAVEIIGDVFGSYKLANVGAPLGTIDQDRLAAVSGRLGPTPPTTAITSVITNLDEDRTTTGRTDVVLEELVADVMMMHGWVNFDLLAFDDPFVAGTAEVSWTINGVDGDGGAWSVTRENRHASRGDLSSAALWELVETLWTIDANPFTDVRMTSVGYTANASTPYDAYELLAEDLPVDGVIELEPGTTLEIDVPMRRFRSEVETVTVRLEVPSDAAGAGELVLTGGAWDVCFEEPWLCDHTGGGSFDELLDGLATRPRNDDLTATLTLYPDGGWDPGDPGWPVEPGEPGWPSPDEPDVPEVPGFAVTGPDTPTSDVDGQPQDPINGVVPPGPWPGPDYPEPIVVTTSERLDAVVTGYVSLPVFVAGHDDWRPPDLDIPTDELAGMFVDVDETNVHHDNILLAAALGLTQGVSSDPPRFVPDGLVRRDQAASFVARLLALGPVPLPELEQASFVDLEGNVHAEAIEQLAAVGIVQGRGDGRFDPAAQVSRAQLTSMLIAALEFATAQPLEAEGGPHFPDVTGVHAPAIDAAYELGLATGRPDGTFGPGEPVRRDQTASLLIRTLRWLTEAG